MYQEPLKRYRDESIFSDLIESFLKFVDIRIHAWEVVERAILLINETDS